MEPKLWQMGKVKSFPSFVKLHVINSAKWLLLLAKVLEREEGILLSLDVIRGNVSTPTGLLEDTLDGLLEDSLTGLLEDTPTGLLEYSCN